MHILWALDGLGALEERDLLAALADASPGVREHAVRLAEPRLARLAGAARKGAGAGRRSRAAGAISGRLHAGRSRPIRGRSRRWPRSPRATPTNRGSRTAVLSSSGRAGRSVARGTVERQRRSSPSRRAGAWFEQLATIVGARKQERRDRPLARRGGRYAARTRQRQSAIVLGLGAGLQRSSSTLEAAQPAASAAAGEMLERSFADAAKQASDAEATGGRARAALRLLGYVGGQPAIETLGRSARSAAERIVANRGDAHAWHVSASRTSPRA